MIPAQRLGSTKILLVWLLLLSPVSIRAGSGYSIDYLYIEAGEGDSSGGHAAIRFGEDVFHYQYARGLLKSVRQNRSEFEYQYRFLGNRTIHVSRIAVSKAAYENQHEFFARNHLVQNRQFKGIELIKNDLALLEKLFEAQSRVSSTGTIRYPVKGAGLFSKAGHPPDSRNYSSFSVTADFGQRVVQEYGQAFLARRKAQIDHALAKLRATGWPSASTIASPDDYPILPYSMAERFADLITNRLALEVVEFSGSLNPSLRIESDPPGFTLDPREVEALRSYRNDLQKDLLKLSASSRPDWGYPLLVGLARLQVLDESLQRGKLVFLSTYPDNSKHVAPADLVRYREAFRVLFSEARTHFGHAKARILAASAMNESDYAQLELLANRYSELARGLAGKPMRIHEGDLAPRGMAEMRLSVLPEISKMRIVQESERLTGYLAEYSDRLETWYSYHILTRNCVSEIFRTIERAAIISSQDNARSTSTASAPLLQKDGTIDHRLWNSIPFVSSITLDENFTIRDTEALLSFRQTQLQAMYATEIPLLAYFRESNILTSTLYPWNPDDGLFVFFTDDAVWPRPLFGAVNTVAGIGQTVIGGVISPFVGGEVFFNGMKSFLSSLPELVFFNIRKGSYRYQPFDQSLKREVGAF